MAIIIGEMKKYGASSFLISTIAYAMSLTATSKIAQLKTCQ